MSERMPSQTIGSANSANRPSVIGQVRYSSRSGKVKAASVGKCMAPLIALVYVRRGGGQKS